MESALCLPFDYLVMERFAQAMVGNSGASVVRVDTVNWVLEDMQLYFDPESYHKCLNPKAFESLVAQD